MMEDPKTDAKTREFLKEKFKRAKELLEDFSKRSETLEKIVRKIIDSQQGVFGQGIDLASRRCRRKAWPMSSGCIPPPFRGRWPEKYIQTPQGLYPVKFLCPRGPKGMTAARLKAMMVGDHQGTRIKHIP